MKRALIVAVSVLVPAVAHARGSHCREVSPTVGHQRCTRFGAWSHGAAMWWDFGVSALRFSPRPIDAFSSTLRDGSLATYHVTAAAGDERPVTASGFRLRQGIGGRTFYFASELDLAPITTGPALVADVATRGISTTMTSTTGGWVTQDKLGLGAHVSVGPVLLATELMPGLRMASYTSQQLPDAVHAATQAWFVLDLHQRADVWLTPNVSLGFEVAVDLAHHDDVGVGLTLGLHITPYDRTR
jgi:hypothetical protein